jgi:GTP diphosphokinase / guanosine-3',5'-bis(diphosphate) 3'-diphosphatase
MVEFRKTTPVENRESFEMRLKDFPLKEKENIKNAYQAAKKAHRNQLRDSGIRYFEHPRYTFLILFDECGIREEKLLVSSLVHDVPEDTFYFGDSPQNTYEDSVKIIKHNIKKKFGEEVAEIVISLSKPRGKDLANLSEETVGQMYHRQLEKASVDTLLVKMADRLHNLRELSACTSEKQQRKIKETEEFYFPLFEKVLTKYPKEGKYLLDQMRIAISKLKN